MADKALEKYEWVALDWPKIKAEVLSGRSVRDVARDFNVSHSAINKRAKREGWLPSAAPAKTTAGVPALSALGQRTKENAESIIADLSAGGSLDNTVRKHGFEPDEFLAWVKDDPTWHRRVDATLNAYAVHLQKKIGEAANRGDWKPASWWLGRSKLTRDEFGDSQRHGTGEVKVIFNWSRDEPPPPIDITPASREKS